MDFSTLITEQDKRNFIRNSDVNLFVEAGPGAGKTTFISKRIINQIKRGASPDNFVFIAFTKEAAQEIRDKIKKNIKRDLVKAEGEEEEILARALVNLPKMSIMTIAELCLSILENGGWDTSCYGETVLDIGICEQSRRLLFDTMECLRTEAGLLERLKKVYAHIYVDEYQDTNELQTAILWMLASDEGGECLRDGALFVVGDDKQSIYLKEGADVAVFRRIRGRMRDMENAGVITLYENYRSEESIIDFFNDRFSGLFFDYEPAKKDWTIKRKETFHGVKRVTAASKQYDEMNDRILVSKLINTLCTSEEALLEDKNTGEARRIHYSDFLVIVNSEESAEKYRKIAAENGVDVSENGVNILSLHTVKGLSGNIVVVADRSQSIEEYFDTTAVSAMQKEEWTRYEYVATTRARHALVFLPKIVENARFSEPEFRLEELPALEID